MTPLAAAPARFGGTDDRRPARVVVADDQPDVRVALCLLLKAEGYEAEAAGSPAALLDALSRRRADLVLMDLNYTRDTTSGTEGLDLLVRLRERDQAAAVVVMTAWGTIDLAVEAMRRGARGFVLKPWDNQGLLRTVATELAARPDPGRLLPAAERAAHDLTVARRVQTELLPRTQPPLATLDYAGVCLQAGAVGGDVYDFIDLGPGTTAFVLADASGKGVPAALLMANLQGLLRSQAGRASLDLAGYLRDVNEQFYASTAPEHYATLFFGVFDDASRTLRYLNCGHNPPLVLRADGRREYLVPGAPAMGLLQNWSATPGALRLDPGDWLLLYSDGVTEAGRDRGTEFGEARLFEALRARRQLTPSELLPGLVSAVEAFAGAAHEDDLTLVAARAR
jgi:sigma-B regulation protein RsbU (phosphoserine phosphatase)